MRGTVAGRAWLSTAERWGSVSSIRYPVVYVFSCCGTPKPLRSETGRAKREAKVAKPRFLQRRASMKTNDACTVPHLAKSRR